jgi:hypothetical protein
MASIEEMERVAPNATPVNYSNDDSRMRHAKAGCTTQKEADLL